MQDHSPIHQVFGPPGCGKTEYLRRRVAEIVARYGPDAVAIASFSVTGAKEIASRVTGLRPRGIGTLHSFAYRAIGSDLSVALDPKVLADWNDSVPRDWRITADTRRATPSAATESGGANTDATTARGGDDLIAALDKARATRTDPADHPPDLRAFATAWQSWKDGAHAVDYTDMIELALERALDGEAAPGNPDVFIIDEGQDNTPLEVDLVLAWGARARSLVIALDDDQAIMEWRGGDPRRMLTLDQDTRFRLDRQVLDKSWRVPRAVHAVAERWVRRLSQRQEKAYHPRTVHENGVDTGEIVEGAAYSVPESLSDPRLVNRVETEVAHGRTVMIIASCAYMLNGLISTLRESGIPFHNPFRPTEARWNPLGNGSGTSTAQRVYRYLLLDPDLPPYHLAADDGTTHSTPRHRAWTGDDIRAWLPLLDAKAAGLRRGAKTTVDELPDGEIPWEDVASMFADEGALDRAVAPDLEWFAGAVMPSKLKAVRYPLQVARKRGAVALDDTPKVVLGTIHSVKGAAADIVYVAPDLSPAGMDQLSADTSGRDQMIRLFYVAMTRAYRELRLLAPMGPRNYIRRSNLLPTDLEVRP